MDTWKTGLIGGLLLALTVAATWNVTFEGTPSGTDPVSEGDDRVRELKSDIRNGLETEHLWSESSTPANDSGRHREGSARAFYESAAPTVIGFSDSGSGIADKDGSTVLDAGRLWFDSDDGLAKIYNGSSWTQFPGAFSGTVNLLGTPLFTKNGADSMDIHAHAARHRLSGSNGAWVAALDRIPFAIQEIVTDTTVDTAACGIVNSTGLTSQVFGDAGNACLSITRNFTGRTGLTTRGLFLIEIMTDEPTDNCITDAALYVDSLSTRLGEVHTIVFVDSAITGIEKYGITYFHYVTGLTAASHEFAIHASDVQNDGCKMNGTDSSLIWIDLGTE